MTVRQKILKFIYPLIILSKKLKGNSTNIFQNENNIQPHTSVYNIPFELNNGNIENLSAYKGKKILIVNTASDCGYTNQYEALQKLYEQNAGKLVIIGFPSNDFKEQEKGNDDEIAEFCKANYGITFPLAKKSVVIKNSCQHKIFEWLSHKKENGWLDKTPSWNFCKYLINEEGMLTHYFKSAVEPSGSEITIAIQS
jgi:glutathione peroxidase